MIGSVTTSRRAHAFAQDLDEHEHKQELGLGEAMATDQAAGDGSPGVTDTPGQEAGAPATSDGPPPAPRPSTGDGGTEQSLLAVAEKLAALPRPGLSPETKTVQRAQLIAAMESEFGSSGAETRHVPEQRGAHQGRGAHRAPHPGPLGKLRPKSRLSKSLAAGGLGVGVAASALGGVASASAHALPGESLYGVKRGMEDLQLDLAHDDSDLGRVHLDHASTRLQEARRLMERTRSGSPLDHESLGEVRKALSGMHYDASEGHRLLSAAYARDGSIAPMRSLSSFSKSHRAAWRTLRHRLPPQLSDMGEQVSSVFDAIDSDVSPLEGLLSGSRKGSPRIGGGSGPAHDETSTSPSSPNGSAKDGRHGGKNSDSPSPSGRPHHDGGLIGGSGLLDPSKAPDQSPSTPGLGRDPLGGDGAVGGGRKLQTPDVTLPPIVPDVLPDLHGHGGTPGQG